MKPVSGTRWPILIPLMVVAAVALTFLWFKFKPVTDDPEDPRFRLLNGVYVSLVHVTGPTALTGSAAGGAGMAAGAIPGQKRVEFPSLPAPVEDYQLPAETLVALEKEAKTILQGEGVPTAKDPKATEGTQTGAVLDILIESIKVGDKVGTRATTKLSRRVFGYSGATSGQNAIIGEYSKGWTWSSEADFPKAMRATMKAAIQQVADSIVYEIKRPRTSDSDEEEKK